MEDIQCNEIAFAKCFFAVIRKKEHLVNFHNSDKDELSILYT